MDITLLRRGDRLTVPPGWDRMNPEPATLTLTTAPCAAVLGGYAWARGAVTGDGDAQEKRTVLLPRHMPDSTAGRRLTLNLVRPGTM